MGISAVWRLLRVVRDVIKFILFHVIILFSIFQYLIIIIIYCFCLLIKIIAEVRCKIWLILISTTLSLIHQRSLLANFCFKHVFETVSCSRYMRDFIVFLKFIDLSHVGDFCSSLDQNNLSEWYYSYEIMQLWRPWDRTFVSIYTLLPFDNYGSDCIIIGICIYFVVWS